MIATDFAPNESGDDAILSLKLLFQPWRWKKGKELDEAKSHLLKILNVPYPKFHIQPFLTGRSALYHLIKSLHLPKDAEVLVQAFTCEAVVLPIVANHLRPVYVDIETKSFSMDPIDLAKKIGKRSKVLILQHTFGLDPDHKKEIVALVNQHKLLLIEDIAHTIKNVAPHGLIDNSTYLLSFGRSKAISSVFGGAIVTSDRQIKAKLGQIVQKLPHPSFGFMIRLLFYKPVSVFIKNTYDFYIGKFIHKIIIKLQILIPEISRKEKRGELDEIYNKAYPNGLAILLNHQLKKYEQIQKNRAQICDIYQKSIKKFKFQISNVPLIRFPVLVNNRDRLLRIAAQCQIFLGKWYDQVVAPKSVDLTKMSYKRGSCPTAEATCDRIINLPTLISQDDAKKVVGLLTTYGN